MNTRDQRVEAILATALEQADPALRREYLEEVCAGDASLRQEVESLLAAHDEAGDFLAGQALSAVPQLPPGEKAGDRVGRYKLLEQIGEGGFGVVWMAEQEEPVRRRVALKIIKLGMDTREVVARFEAERQALAMMNHPNIASVFDGGATDTGRPYFVMELVKGIPITDYCDAQRLSTRERLELFMQVCQAIQHAHQKGVIHRDLKPSNILVTVQDDRPVPKVIDFGVARVRAILQTNAATAYVPNSLGETPLLLERKADPNVEDTALDTPLALARKKGLPQIVRILSGRNAQPSKPKNE
jgi:serine/threonine protein kinase